MSETITPGPLHPPSLPPESINPPTTPGLGNMSTAAAAGGGSGALMVVIVWALSLVHIAIPPEVSVALSALLSPLLHWAIVKYGLPPPT